MIFDSFRMYC